MSTILPAHIRAALANASRVDSRPDPDGTCEARNAAVEAAIVAAREECKQFFDEEK